jgi:hypothetical protein
MIREADRYPKRLLVAAPDASDAYLGLGERQITLSGVCQDSRSFSLASLESTVTRKQASSSSRSPPITAITCGCLRRFCWRWWPCVRTRRKWPAHNSRSLSWNSRKTRFLPGNYLNSMFLRPRLYHLNSDPDALIQRNRRDCTVMLRPVSGITRLCARGHRVLTAVSIVLSRSNRSEDAL